MIGMTVSRTMSHEFACLAVSMGAEGCATAAKRRVNKSVYTLLLPCLQDTL